jgi:glycine/D-amino acid oxidase-like deaminating enzyme/nitrite reductase/ring-hydroxylating ferredoxin subunit
VHTTLSSTEINTASPWLDDGLIETQPLGADIRCDVCVVGAGIAGLLVAERLREGLGMTVAVLDSGAVAGGETCRTTAHFVTALDDRYMELERLHGEVGARLAAQSHAAAIDHVESLITRLGIDCGWERLDGYLTVGRRHADKRDRILEEELAAAGRAGLMIERVPTVPEPWPQELGPALRFPAQAQVHPIRLLNAVVGKLLDRGVAIHTGTRVVDVHGGDHAAVETESGRVVRCKHVVVATNTPINNLVAVHTKQSGYQTYVLGFRVEGAALPALLLWDGLWEDDTSYHYVRMASDGEHGDLLIVGGEDHKTGQGPVRDEPYRRLEEWTRAHFPMCGAIERRWSGEVMEPVDGLAYIGHNALGRDNVYVVTGDSGNGMTHGAIAAMLIPDLIAGRDNPWSTLYDPAPQVGVHSLRDYASENLNTVAQYGDWLRHGDVSDESQIKPGSGAIIAKGLKRLAVYKDESGACTHLSAMCPHLGGVVRWNDLEKTWDCPCHASRFAKDGAVIHGPANRGLTRETKL